MRRVLPLASLRMMTVSIGLANRSVDYLAEDVTPSPVQHYWSLAVEEQFYLLWPVLLLIAIASETVTKWFAENAPGCSTLPLTTNR